jgi:hypothetical protein
LVPLWWRRRTDLAMVGGKFSSPSDGGPSRGSVMSAARLLDVLQRRPVLCACVRASALRMSIHLRTTTRHTRQRQSRVVTVEPVASCQQPARLAALPQGLAHLATVPSLLASASVLLSGPPQKSARARASALRASTHWPRRDITAYEGRLHAAPSLARSQSGH